MKVKTLILAAVLLFPNITNAGEWEFDATTEGKALYGYINISKRYRDNTKYNHDVLLAQANFSLSRQFDNDYALSLNFDIMGGVDKELKDYNQGDWGEEAYAIADMPLGRLMLGQTTNVAAQFHTGAPSVGALSNNRDVVNFISNPNWVRDGKVTKFATLDSTAIDTDGVAPKISYISPEFYNTYLGLSYVPDAYNRAGLISRYASYKEDGGYVAALYTAQELPCFDLTADAGFARFHNNDNEFSLGVKLQKGNWSLGGGWRKTYIDGQDKQENRSITEVRPEFFDAYREGEAYNIGIGYDIGPLETALTYFVSKASHSDNKNEIITWSNQYQINKNLDIFLAASHVNFDGQDHTTQENNSGYAFVTGIGINF